jgi:hypothetical protein
MDKSGKIHLSSLKKIDIDLHTSRWPRALDYFTIYKQLGLPDRELLFEGGKLSPFVHTFLMSHPDIFNVSKELIGSGYGVYLGYKEMNRKFPEEANVEKIPVDITEALDNVSLKLHEVRKSSDSQKLIYIPQNISINKANQHLRYGFYREWEDENIDPRIRSGERVVATEKDTGRMISINSPAYNWRSSMRFSKYIPFCFFIHAHAANIHRKLAKAGKNGTVDYFAEGFFPNLPKANPVRIKEYVQEGVPIIKLVDGPKLDLTKYEDRLENIWLCMLLAVPIHQQIEVLTCIEQYRTKLQQGAANALAITKSKYHAEGRLYSPEVFNDAVYVSYMKKPKVKYAKFIYEQIQIDNIVRKLTEMKPTTSYYMIKSFSKEITRVKRIMEKEKEK